MRYRLAKDANHKAMTAYLRARGIWHLDVSHHLGLGCDLIVRHKDGYPVFIEIKDPAKPPSARKLKPSEAAMREAFAQFYRVCLDEGDLAAAVIGFS